jgi:DsbC/DsbD-like thiol-disulfide interchange protein
MEQRSRTIIVFFALAAILAIYLAPPGRKHDETQTGAGESGETGDGKPHSAAEGEMATPPEAALAADKTNGESENITARADDDMSESGEKGEGDERGGKNDDVSPWSRSHKAMVRLIAGDRGHKGKSGKGSGKGSAEGPDELTFMAAIQIKLEDGWKTYWRSPGEAGTPPEFDWTGTSGASVIEMKWPAPQKFADPYSATIGYKHEVVLPLRIRAQRADKPVKLALKMNYGICADICVPAQARLNLTIKPQMKGRQSMIARWLKKTPWEAKAIGEEHDGLAISRVEADFSSPSPHIAIEAKIPANAKNAELYAEAPGERFLPMARSADGGETGKKRFVIDLEKENGLDQLALTPLTFTLVADGRALSLTYSGGEKPASARN